MHLGNISIQGYKLFKDQFTIEFNKGVNVIVGENGTGKSAIVDAVRMLLLEDEFGRSPISSSDFHTPYDGSLAASALQLEGCFNGLSTEENAAFLPWSDLEGNAKLTLLVDAKPSHRGRYKRTLYGGASKASFFEWELFESINCIYLPPLRDAEAKLREGKSSRLARLLKNLNKQEIDQARNNNEKLPIEEQVEEFNNQLAKDENGPIAKANALIKDRLVKAVGESFGQDTLIQFSETSFDRIVENLRLFFFPEVNPTTEAHHFRSLNENSLGYNNLLYLATVLAELTEDVDSSDFVKILLIEEPEAHLHPQLQIRLLKYLERTADKQHVQIIVTTHSPVLASAVSLNSVIHLSQPEDGPTAISLRDCGLPPHSVAFVHRWLDATKSTLLFAKGIILVEGIAEAMLIPEMAKLVLKKYNKQKKNKKNKLPRSLEDAGVSVVNLNGIYFRHFMQLFANHSNSKGKNIPIRCAGLTDFDPPKNIVVVNGKKKKKPCKPTPSNPPTKSTNPTLKSADDEPSLVKELESSTWCRLFHNNLKTLEYDLAMEEDNLKILLPVARVLEDGPKITEKYENFEETDWALASDDEKAEASQYILAHIDKGEFAQALAYKVSRGSKLAIPEYIQDAVVWACGGDV